MWDKGFDEQAVQQTSAACLSTRSMATHEPCPAAQQGDSTRDLTDIIWTHGINTFWAAETL